MDTVLGCCGFCWLEYLNVYTFSAAKEDTKTLENKKITKKISKLIFKLLFIFPS